MRQLSIKQKQIIMDYVKKFYFTPAIRTEMLGKLESINDYETLYQDVDRFISDYNYSLDGDRYLLDWRNWK